MRKQIFYIKKKQKQKKKNAPKTSKTTTTNQQKKPSKMLILQRIFNTSLMRKFYLMLYKHIGILVLFLLSQFKNSVGRTFT